MNSNANIAFKQTFFASRQAIIPKGNYIKLQQRYNPLKKEVHAFFENADDFEFYRTAINYYYRDYQIIDYFQEGKQNVKEGYFQVDWRRFKKEIVLFFVDKDYDDILQKSKIESQNFFYTSFYSIENYLVNSEVYEIVLKFFFTRMDDNVKFKLIKNFNQAYPLFQQRIKVLTRFILIYREINKDLDLDKLRMHDFMLIDTMKFMERKLVLAYVFDRIQDNPKSTTMEKALIRKETIVEILANKCLADKSLVNFKKLMRMELILSRLSEAKVFIRGKYDLWFLLEMIKHSDKAIAEIYRIEKIPITVENPMPKKKKYDINATSIFHLISSKLIIHQDLKDFLAQNYSSINENN